MRHEPAGITTSDVASILVEEYGLHANIVFQPVGEGSWSYTAKNESAQKYFIKLLRGDFYKPMVDASLYLKEHGIECAPVIRSRSGAPFAPLKEYALVVYGFLEGDIIGDRQLSNAQWEKIGVLFGKLHSVPAPDFLKDELRHEDFARFQTTAGRVIQFYDQGKASGPIQTELAALVADKRKDIEHIFARARELGGAFKATKPTLNICHADAHVWNIFLSPNGDITLIDWDSVMYAPKERDLMFFTGHEEKDFLKGYALIRPGLQANPTGIAYYKYEWVVQEIADYGERVFFSDMNDEARQHALDKFKELFGKGNVVDQAYEWEKSNLS